MYFVVKFKEENDKFKPNFGEIYNVSDGGFERGYNEGYAKGNQDGYNNGYEVGNTKGLEDGKQAEYDRFWDSLQNNGKRTNYNYAFAGQSWNDETFKPKYDIVPTGATNYYIFQNSLITDLKKILKDCNVVLDMSKCSYCLDWFNNSSITTLPELNLKSATNILCLGNATKLKWVDKVILSYTASQTFQTGKSFNNNALLEHCIFEGVIRTANFDIHWSTLLDKESLTSIINCLAETTSGIAVTLSLVAVNKAFETSEGAKDGSNSTEWQTLVETKKNWTINLA